ncbi:MAG: chromosomal replication initiator protein DnaA [Prevotellaceae bacterium]|jgi:chromosomal replication initiator protein|nr:chromosomal replication initiator protein DnaA [Prevotellaceae bacterium]
MVTTDESGRIWNECLRIIRDNVTPTTFDCWFAKISVLKLEGKTLTVHVPSQFFYEYLEEHYADLLQRTLYKVVGEEAELMYHVQVVDGTGGTTAYPQQPLPIPNGTQALGNRSPKTLVDAVVAVPDLDSQLNSKYTFENFIAGDSNKLSRSVAESVAQSPAATAFNPLFIHGVSGVGKTHLCNAIGNRVKTLHPHLRVLYVSAHLFGTQYRDAVINNRQNDFIHFYQQIDVLIIDDVQEWAGHTKTQNTFFHIFNHLHQNRKQLILASDRPPFELQGMEERLITRFKWGMVAELERPSAELRKDILHNKIRRDGLDFPEDVIAYVAENVTNSVRDLEGVIISLMAHSTIYNTDINLALAQQVIARNVKRAPQAAVTVDTILDTVCSYFNVSPVIVQSKNRKRETVEARQIAMYLARKHTENSSGQIGKLIGRRDHATVLHAFKVVQQQLEVSHSFRSTLSEIEEALLA